MEEAKKPLGIAKRRYPAYVANTTCTCACLWDTLPHFYGNAERAVRS